MHPSLRLLLPIAFAFAVGGCATLDSGDGSASSTASTERSTAKASAAPPEKSSGEPRRTAAAESSTPARQPERQTSARSGTETRASDAGDSTARLVTQLNEASRELATLRAANARLRTERERGTESPGPARADATDAKVAASVRSYSQFKQDLAAFIAETEKARSEYGSLNAKLKDASVRADEARAAVTRLEADLRREKAARIEAEQAATKLREQLRVIARAMASAGLNVDKIAGDGGASGSR